MEASSLAAAVLTLVATLFLAAHIRIVRDAERLVIYRLGRFLGLRGPGLILKLLYIDSGERLVLGTGGEALSSSVARFGSIEVTRTCTQAAGSRPPAHRPL